MRAEDKRGDSLQGRETVSDLALDAHVLAGRPDASLAEGERARVGELRAQAAHFQNSVASRELEEHLVSRLRRGALPAPRRDLVWWRPALGLGAMAVALAAVFVTAPPRANHETIRVKGNMAVEAWVQRDGQSAPLRGEHVLQAGDRVGFRVAVGAASHVALFGTSGEAAVALVPANGGSALALSPGVRTELPASALLDDQGHEERFALVACPQPFEAQPVASALAGWAAGDSAEATASALVERQVSPACDTVFLSYAKR